MTNGMHWHQDGPRQHDGFRVSNAEGAYSFVEGISRPLPMMTRRESASIEACAKHRGIFGTGYFVIENPEENKTIGSRSHTQNRQSL